MYLIFLSIESSIYPIFILDLYIIEMIYQLFEY